MWVDMCTCAHVQLYNIVQVGDINSIGYFCVDVKKILEYNIT